MEQSSRVIRLLKEVRSCAQACLPMNDSLIAYDLILYIASMHSEQKPIGVKQFFSALPHSYTAIRHHYKRLLDDGYVVHKHDERDRRVKLIQPTEKFASSIANYTNKVKELLET